MDKLIIRAAELFDVPIMAIVSDSRAHHVSEARQAVAYAARQRTTLGLKAIAVCLGRKDHTTIIFACKAAEQRATTDYDYALALADLLSVL
jgi:chromosomal replication initiator protein